MSLAGAKPRSWRWPDVERGGALECLDHVPVRTIRDPRPQITPLDEIHLGAERCRQLALDARLIDQGEALGRAWREVER